MNRILKIITKIKNFRLTPQKIATLYTLNLMVIFQLFILNAYSDIQDAKLYYWIFSTIIALALLIIIQIARWLGVRKTLLVLLLPVVSWIVLFIIYLTKSVKKRRAIAVEEPSAEKKALSPLSLLKKLRDSVVAGLIKLKNFIVNGYKKISLPEKFLAGFFLVAVISTIFSDHVYEAFWGNMGRLQGCYTWIFYVAGYFIITRLYRPQKWHIDLYIFSAVLTCIWAILDFYHMSPIGWQDASGGDTAFRSAFGNIDTVAGYHGLVVAICTTLFVCHREERTRTNILRTIYYGLCTAISFMALVTDGSDNAVLSAAAVAAFLPFVAFQNLRNTIRYVIALGLWLVTAFAINFGISMADLSMSEATWGVLASIFVGHLNLTMALLVADVTLVIVLFFISILLEGKINQKLLTRILRIIWTALGVAAFIGIIVILYDANTGGHKDIYESYSKFLIFDDNWGSGRGFAWGMAYEIFIHSSPLKILIGTGPETFFISAMENFYDDMIERGILFDSPHGEQIQYLLTTGILGFLCYYGWMATSAFRGIRAQLKNIGSFPSYACAFAFAVIAHFFASAVNISAPTAFPLTVLALALVVALTREDKGGVCMV